MIVNSVVSHSNSRVAVVLSGRASSIWHVLTGIPDPTAGADRGNPKTLRHNDSNLPGGGLWLALALTSKMSRAVARLAELAEVARVLVGKVSVTFPQEGKT